MHALHRQASTHHHPARRHGRPDATLLDRVLAGVARHRRAKHLPLGLKRALRAQTLRACGHRCVYCGTRLDPTTATLDHVHPRALGGTNDPANLVAACTRCNRLKADLSVEQWFRTYPVAARHFLRYAHAAHRELKRRARQAASRADARLASAAA